MKALAMGFRDLCVEQLMVLFEFNIIIYSCFPLFVSLLSPSSGPKNKRRKNDRRVSSRDRRADYYEDSSSPHHEHHGGSSRDARYNDMAPK